MLSEGISNQMKQKFHIREFEHVYVFFNNSNKKFLNMILKNGFSHCFFIVVGNTKVSKNGEVSFRKKFQLYEISSKGLSCFYVSEHVFDKCMKEYTYLKLRFSEIRRRNMRLNRLYKLFSLFSLSSIGCVNFVKMALNFKCLAITPFGLFRKLKKHSIRVN